jgi:cystathionine gamma-lyase
VPEKERALLGIGDDLIRLSVGIEEGDDLVRDVEAALEVAARE